MQKVPTDPLPSALTDFLIIHSPRRNNSFPIKYVSPLTPYCALFSTFYFRVPSGFWSTSYVPAKYTMTRSFHWSVLLRLTADELCAPTVHSPHTSVLSCMLTLAFLECRMLGIMQHLAFSYVLFLVSNRHLNFLHGFSWFHSLRVFNDK